MTSDGNKLAQNGAGTGGDDWGSFNPPIVTANTAHPDMRPGLEGVC